GTQEYAQDSIAVEGNEVRLAVAIEIGCHDPRGSAAGGIGGEAQELIGRRRRTHKSLKMHVILCRNFKRHAAIRTEDQIAAGIYVPRGPGPYTQPLACSLWWSTCEINNNRVLNAGPLGNRLRKHDDLRKTRVARAKGDFTEDSRRRKSSG